MNINEFDDLTEAKITITDRRNIHNKRHRNARRGCLLPAENATERTHTRRLRNMVDYFKGSCRNGMLRQASSAEAMTGISNPQIWSLSVVTRDE